MNEAALKERLKIIAIEKETTLNKIWKQLLLERFLARLSESPYQDKFIFKGGLLLAQYIAINRETIDKVSRFLLAKFLYTSTRQRLFLQKSLRLSFPKAPSTAE